MKSEKEEPASRGVAGRFPPGQSGNPKGRAALPLEVRDALRADTLVRYNRLKKLSRDAEREGDIKTAANIELALFKKQVPDLSAIEITGEDGGPIKTESIDVRRLDKADLMELRRLRDKAAK